MAYNPNNPNGQATSANSAPVVLASDQSAVPISDNGGSLTVDGSVTVSGTVTANAGTGTQNVSVQNASIPVTDNGGSLTVDGTVSVSNFPATQPVSGPLTDTQLRATAVPISGTVSTGLTQPLTNTELRATAVPVSGTVTANAGTGTMNVSVQNASIPVTDNGGSLTVDGTVTANAGTGTFNTSDANAVGQSSATAAQKGYLSLAGATATLPTYTAGNTNAMTMTTSGLLRVDGSNVTQPVSGTITANAGTGAAPHNFGLTTVHKDGEYTTAQTTTALWTPTTGKKFVVTDITISTGGTTSGIVTVFDSAAATAYSAGTTPAIFRGEFAPSATAKPGAVKSFNVPYCSTTVNNRLHVTTSAAMTVYIQLNGYEI